jgi:hypothetical protein
MKSLGCGRWWPAVLLGGEGVVDAVAESPAPHQQQQQQLWWVRTVQLPGTQQQWPQQAGRQRR